MFSTSNSVASGRHWLSWANRGQMCEKNSSLPSPLPSSRVLAYQPSRSCGVSEASGTNSARVASESMS